MTITYLDGGAVQAVLLTRAGDTIRVAIEGADDATEFRKINGIWVSDDCEPARIDFAWQQMSPEPAISEVDCCCSQDLADRLIGLLFTGSKDEEDAAPASPETVDAPDALKNPIRLRTSAN